MTLEIFYFYQASFLLGAFFFNAVAQVLAFRLGGVSLVKSLFVGYTCGLMCLLGFEAGLLVQSQVYEVWAWSLVNSVIYSGVSYCYFHYVNIGEASVRIRVLKELKESIEGLTREALFEKYNAHRIIEVRLERLLSSGQVRFENGRYYNAKPRMLYVAKTFRFLKLLILGNRRLSESNP